MGLLALAGCRQIFGIHEPPSSDGGGISDISVLLDASTCKDVSLECASDTVLRSCTAVGEPPVDTACDWGCRDSPTPHCAVLTPHGGAVAAEDTTDFTGLFDKSLQGVRIDGSAGTISDNGGTVIRDAGQGVRSGIDYEVRGGVAIFRMKSVVIGDATFLGPYAIAIVTDRHIGVNGPLNLEGACTDRTGGPGGFSGGTLRNGGGGPGGGGGGGAGSTGAGGGGAGGADNGGTGGAQTQPIAGGPPNGDVGITMLVGGSGGGAGNAMSLNASAHGGGGGGALQLVANGDIAITGSINAGGCGGAPGVAGPGGGGGGGAGGSLLFEAPTIVATAPIAANGGGGGGGGASGTQGVAGGLGGNVASGGMSLQGGGGAGGALDMAAGSPGEGMIQNNGGGGGSVGRIRFETRTGGLGGAATISPQPVTVPADVQ